MSVFNIKNRCNDLEITLTELFEEVKNSSPKYKGLSFAMFSNMHRGNYTYGMGPEVMSKANEILNRKEVEKKRQTKKTASRMEAISCSITQSNSLPKCSIGHATQCAERYATDNLAKR